MQERKASSVSYTHLDVYKRQALDKARHFLGQELDVRTIIMPHGASTLPKLCLLYTSRCV